MSTHYIPLVWVTTDSDDVVLLKEFLLRLPFSSSDLEREPLQRFPFLDAQAVILFDDVEYYGTISVQFPKLYPCAKVMNSLKPSRVAFQHNTRHEGVEYGCDPVSRSGTEGIRLTSS